MGRIFHSALYEMSFNTLKFKFLFEVTNDEININPILTCIHVGRNEATLWERVDADMALRNNDEATPTTGVLNMIIRSGDDNRFH